MTEKIRDIPRLLETVADYREWLKLARVIAPTGPLTVPRRFVKPAMPRGRSTFDWSESRARTARAVKEFLRE